MIHHHQERSAGGNAVQAEIENAFLLAAQSIARVGEEITFMAADEREKNSQYEFWLETQRGRGRL